MPSSQYDQKPRSLVPPLSLLTSHALSKVSKISLGGEGVTSLHMREKERARERWLFLHSIRALLVQGLVEKKVTETK